MQKHPIVESLERLIIADDLEKTLKLLLDHQRHENNREAIKELMQLSGWLSGINKQKNLGIAKDSDYEKSRNTIRMSVIEMVSKIKGDENFDSIDWLEEAKDCRQEIHEIISTLVIFYKELQEREQLENKEINGLLKKPKSKVIFDKIHRIFDDSTKHLKAHIERVEKELEDFRDVYLKVYSAYNQVLIGYNKQETEWKTEVQVSVIGLFDLKATYIEMLNTINENINAIDNTINVGGFPAHRRALKRYHATQSKFSNYLSEYIEMINELELTWETITK